MGDLMDAFPGARRALFARYHIGGCQSCGFSDTESLASVCERNENLPVDEVIAHIQSSHEVDQKILIEPTEVADLLKGNNPPAMVDLRTREEFEAVALPGAKFFGQELNQEIFGTWDKGTPIVMYDHTGDRCLDAAAYLLGHGFKNTRAMRGGIDAWSQEVDQKVPRYRIEFE
ncbi:MAG: rhodanese-like domain-containing protein [Verrucomicrobiae bacterium]|nr:rhodanese-like domain-containing protein [Verrucomicrobiae bacterium]